MVALTERQQMVLDFIRASIVERGYPPTLREIGARMGIRSTNGVNDHLRALERKGYLTREDMKSRALRPTNLGTNLGEAANDSGTQLTGSRGERALSTANASSRYGASEQVPLALEGMDDLRAQEFVEITVLGRV